MHRMTPKSKLPQGERDPLLMSYAQARPGPFGRGPRQRTCGRGAGGAPVAVLIGEIRVTPPGGILILSTGIHRCLRCRHRKTEADDRAQALEGIQIWPREDFGHV